MTLGESCTFGTNACASSEEGEVSLGCYLRGDLNSVWYTFIAPSSGRVHLEDRGGLRIQYGFYEIPNCSDLGSAINVWCSIDQEEYIEGLTPGQTYYIQVDGFSNEQGEICLEISDPEAPFCPVEDELYLSGIEPGAVIQEANNLISSSQELPELSNVKYMAGQKIILEPGFSAKGIFSAKIESCEDKIQVLTDQIHLENEQEKIEEAVLTSMGSLQVFPNPTNGLVHLEYPRYTKEKVVLELVDARGKVLKKTQSDYSPGDEKYVVSIDMGQFSSGVYFLTIEEGGKLSYEKFVFMKE